MFRHCNLKENLSLLPVFENLLQEIQEGNDKLKNNYTPKELHLDEFLYFSVIYIPEKDKIVSFSGIQTRPHWPKDVARISSRLYTHPDYRKIGSVPSNFNSTIMMPEQKQWAKEAGLSAVFWSREEASDMLMSKMIRRNNSACRYGFKEKLLQGNFNVCKLGVDKPACWQKIAITEFTKTDFEFLDCRD